MFRVLSCGTNYSRLLQSIASRQTHVRSSTTIGSTLKLQSLDASETLHVTWEDGRISNFHARWLRHNCRCPQCWTNSSYQKIISYRDLEGDSMIVKPLNGGRVENGERLNVQWSTDGGLEHKGQLDVQWLCNHDYTGDSLRQLQKRSRPFFNSGTLPVIPYSEVESSNSEGLWSWLRALNEEGVCLLTNVPTENNKVLEVAEMIGPVMNTFYGPVFDVLYKPNPTNLAYSTDYLPLHVDLAYLESPPGIQLLHCLRKDPQVEGGESILLDGWSVAEIMKKSFPAQFKVMTDVPATFDKIQDEKLFFRHRKTHIVVDRDGEVVGINWSPQNHGPLFIPEDEIEPYYKAYNVLGRLLEESQYKIFHMLKPGELLTFNNRRFLHSRTTYVANNGIRHLKGAYVSNDDFKSTVNLVAKRVCPDYMVKAVLNGCSY